MHDNKTLAYVKKVRLPALRLGIKLRLTGSTNIKEVIKLEDKWISNIDPELKAYFESLEEAK